MKIFPQITKSQRHGLLGIPILETFVVDVAKYILRETPQKVDVGIDGYIDMIEGEVHATGRCIAFQLKCGPSFFESKTKDGFTYYGEIRHLNLFMNHPVPVIVVLADPSSKKIWWVKFDVSKTEGTESGWKMVVPFKNECGPATAAEWKLIAGKATDYLGIVSEEWNLRKSIKRHDLVIFEIPRSDIENMRFDFVIESFARLTSSSEMIEKKRNAVEFTIGGYQDDERELWEIPQVRRWWMFAESVGKYWFYFCRIDHRFASLQALFLCVTKQTKLRVDKNRKMVEWRFDVDSQNEFLVRHYTWLNEFTEKYDLPLAINYQVSVSVPEFLGIVPKGKIKPLSHYEQANGAEGAGFES
jgi:hypothetical protein